MRRISQISIRPEILSDVLLNSQHLTHVPLHYSDVIMRAIASQITSLTIVHSTVYSGADQRKIQSSASLAFVRGSHRWPVNSPHKRLVTRKMFPFNDLIMKIQQEVWKTLGPVLMMMIWLGDTFHITAPFVKATHRSPAGVSHKVTVIQILVFYPWHE